MRRTAFAVAAMLAASAASAETIRIEGLYPAASDKAAALRSIQVEPFGGDVGDDLTIQVEDALRGVDLGQGPYFRVIPAATGSGGEALLRGTGDTEQRFSEYTEEHERCIKDAKGACTSAKEKVTVKCRRRHIDLVVALRLVGRDGTLLWSDNRPESYEDSYCEDSVSSPRTRNAIARELSGRIARRVRTDFAPRREIEDVRIDESRKGLPKPEGERFKGAVRKVKLGDIAGACADFRSLMIANVGHVPSLYNMGLCYEVQGQFGAASSNYALTLELDPKNARARRGLDRLAAGDRADAQLKAHAQD